MKKISFNIALGGIISALCVLLMFFVAVFPAFLYVLPILCGLLLSIVYFECGLKTSLISYASVALLSLIISPDKESALLFTSFFGYYPIAKIYIDRINHRVIRMLIKFVLFNVSVIASYFVLIAVFGIVDISDFGSDLEKYGLIILLILGNIVMAVYDVATKKVTAKYLLEWRKKFFKNSR